MIFFAITFYTVPADGALDTSATRVTDLEYMDATRSIIETRVDEFMKSEVA